MATKLEEIGNQERNILLAKNEYSTNDEYGLTNKNALSDGDDKGKGDVNGSVGSATDIEERKTLLGRNEYAPNFEYDSTNPNAQSDGDDKGKGQVGDSGTIGSKQDIYERVQNTKVNPYNSNKTYPDFEY